jgi:hypothetical protein
LGADALGAGVALLSVPAPPTPLPPPSWVGAGAPVCSVTGDGWPDGKSAAVVSGAGSATALCSAAPHDLISISTTIRIATHTATMIIFRFISLSSTQHIPIVGIPLPVFM